MAVCGKTFAIYSREPYASQITPLSPNESVPLDDALEYDYRQNDIRHPRETKGQDYDATQLPEDDCSGDSGCC